MQVAAGGPIELLQALRERRDARLLCRIKAPATAWLARGGLEMSPEMARTCRSRMSALTASIGENDLKQLIADVTRAMEKAQQAVASGALNILFKLMAKTSRHCAVAV